jgi:hypothetical protein
LKTDAYLALDQPEKAIVLITRSIASYLKEQKEQKCLFELADVYDDHEAFDKVFDCLTINFRRRS